MLEKILESPLDCKKIKPVNPKGNQPWMFIGKIDAEAEGLILWLSDAKSQLIGKDSDAGKDWRQKEKGRDRGWDSYIASLKQWTWIWANSGRLWAWHAAVHGVAKSWKWQQLNNSNIYLFGLYIYFIYLSVAKLCLTLCNPMNGSMPSFRVLHYLPEFSHTHGHWVDDVIQPSHPLSPPSPAVNLSQHYSLFQWVGSLHQIVKVLELQFQRQSIKWTFQVDSL